MIAEASILRTKLQMSTGGRREEASCYETGPYEGTRETPRRAPGSNLARFASRHWSGSAALPSAFVQYSTRPRVHLIINIYGHRLCSINKDSIPANVIIALFPFPWDP
jgi:hypothetical protein